VAIGLGDRIVAVDFGHCEGRRDADRVEVRAMAQLAPVSFSFEDAWQLIDEERRMGRLIKTCCWLMGIPPSVKA
jgi:hypothetical protein